MFETFIARRYLRAKRKQVMISVITVISVIGVAAGVMALVIALAINTGFRNTMERSFLGATSHVMVVERTRGDGISDWREKAKEFLKVPHVQSVLPSLYDYALVSGLNGTYATIKGIPVTEGAPLPDALKHLKAGSMDTFRRKDRLPAVILGSKLAMQIGAEADQQVRLVIDKGQVTPFGARPSVENVLVAGIFETGLSDMDSTWVFMTLPDVQRLWGYGDVANSIELTLDDVSRTTDVAAKVSTMIGKDLEATTWEQQNRHVFEAFALERRVYVIVIGLIQLVAGLNILITLVMMVMEKQRDIAILMAMGARAGQIRRIFVFKGAIIGAIGTGIGLVAGHVLSYFANHYRWVSLDETVYPLAFVPVEPQMLDALWIAAAAMAVSLLATLYPARSATRIAPVEAMRYE
jgi:lipoprotein-releasing system permease protein